MNQALKLPVTKVTANFSVGDILNPLVRILSIASYGKDSLASGSKLTTLPITIMPTDSM